MPRIPDSDLQRLKQDISVQRLVEASGVELKRQGKDWAGCCPFHDDDTASLIVTPAKNLWHCFGCGAAGGPVDWVMRCKGVSFRHAVELLREDAALATAAPDAPVKAPVKASTVRVLAAPVALDADEHALMHQVVDYYHQSLKQSPEALGYLQSRGIGSAEAIEHFKLGYANRTLGLRLPQKNRLAGAELRQALQRLGIIRASGHEHFNGSLVVPILDANGQVADIYGRKLRDDLRAGTPKHLYLPAREGGRGVFNLAALQASPEIILCEAIHVELAASRKDSSLTHAAECLTEPASLARRYPGMRLIYVADAISPEARKTQIAAVREFWLSLGIPETQMLLISGSPDPRDNVAQLKAAAPGKDRKGWLLVTSAMNMPRLAYTFASQGLAVTPYPVDYRTGAGANAWFDAQNIKTVAASSRELALGWALRLFGSHIERTADAS